MLEALSHPEDFLLAQKCLEDDPLALKRLQQTYHGPLLNYLKHTGVTDGEAEMLIIELWSDCIVDRGPRKRRLATYSGNSPLQAWLKAVLLNSLLQKRRKEGRGPVIVSVPPRDDGTETTDLVEKTPDDPHEAPEPTLVEIMRDAVQAAFQACDPEDFLLVHLAHTNGLRGRELARMFACSEAKISRRLEAARNKIEASTLSFVKKRDPWLDLKWEDFVELCRVVSPACFGVE